MKYARRVRARKKSAPIPLDRPEMRLPAHAGRWRDAGWRARQRRVVIPMLVIGLPAILGMLLTGTAFQAWLLLVVMVGASWGLLRLLTIRDAWREVAEGDVAEGAFVRFRLHSPAGGWTETDYGHLMLEGDRLLYLGASTAFVLGTQDVADGYRTAIDGVLRLRLHDGRHLAFRPHGMGDRDELAHAALWLKSPPTLLPRELPPAERRGQA